MENSFVLGVGRKVITPPLGTPLSGYPNERPGVVVNDDLNATAIAMGHGIATALLISVDVCLLGNELIAELKNKINLATGISEDSIIISAIHTHSGPATATIWSGSNQEYVDSILTSGIIEASKEAVSNTVHVKMGIGVTKSLAGVNRRQLTQNNEVLLGQNPFGVFDPEMTVLSFVNKEGTPVANIIHYGCHATAAGENPEITRDWPGVMVDRMEKETSAVTLFINGAEGDIGPRISNGRTTGDLSMAKEVGSVAALDAVRAFKSIKEYRDVTFKTLAGDISIPYKPIKPLEELIKEKDALGDPDTLIEVAWQKYQTLSKAIDMIKNGEEFKTMFTNRQVLFAFNSVVLVPFSFEMFCEISLRLKKYCPYQHTLCLSNANGRNGYLPTEDQLCRGGYEVDMFLYGDVHSLCNDADCIIINEYLKLIEKL